MGAKRRSFASCGVPVLGPAILCGLLLACASSPSPHFYSLSSLDSKESPHAEQQTAPATVQLAVAVGPLHLPRYLERPQIVLRRGDSRLEFDEQNRWAGNLESEMLRVLGENLAILLSTDRIVVYPLVAGFTPKYRVRLYVDRFEGRPGDAVELRVRWELLSTQDATDAVAVETTALRQPLSSSRVDELVQAHDKLLADLSRQIAARIEALEQAAPEPASAAEPVS